MAAKPKPKPRRRKADAAPWKRPDHLTDVMAQRAADLDAATDWDNLTPARHTAAVEALAAAVSAIAAAHAMRR